MKRPKVVVFDFDGVIVDSNNFGIDQFKKVYPTVTFDDYKELLCGNFRDRVDALMLKKIPETEEETKSRRMQAAIDKLNLCPMFPGMIEFIEEIYNMGYKIAMNTSAADINCVPLLEKCGIYNFFDYMGTVEIDRSKVKKFNLIKEKYGVSGEEMIFVTDTLGDILEAKEAGVPTIAVMWGIHDRQYFLREPHENLLAIVDSVEELREKILGKW